MTTRSQKVYCDSVISKQTNATTFNPFWVLIRLKNPVWVFLGGSILVQRTFLGGGVRFKPKGFLGLLIYVPIRIPPPPRVDTSLFALLIKTH